MKCAAIDIGTNTILLVIAQKNGETLTDIADVSTIVRLGEDLVRSGSLKKEAMSRTIDGLRHYIDLAASRGVEKIICVGTEALRKAQNGNEFVAQVKDIFGLDIEIISGRDEAYYTYLSVCNDALIAQVDMTIVDIGGGSTEIINTAGSQFAGYVSLPVGSVVLTDAYVSHDPPRTREVGNVSSFIRKNLEDARLSPGSVLVGTAGTVTNIAALIQGIRQYDKSRIHGFTIRMKDLEGLIAELAPLKSAARKDIPGMEAGREDIIVQGAMILKEVMTHGNFSECIVSAAGVRYGLLYERC